MTGNLFVNPDSIETLEQYASALVCSTISLQTLARFHFVAAKKGILNEDEEETLKTICWEIKRLLSLYQTQIENVLERTQSTQEDIVNNLKTIVRNSNEVRDLP